MREGDIGYFKNNDAYFVYNSKGSWSAEAVINTGYDWYYGFDHGQDRYYAWLELLCDKFNEGADPRGAAITVYQVPGFEGWSRFFQVDHIASETLKLRRDKWGPW